jgi:hypothetical protein
MSRSQDRRNPHTARIARKPLRRQRGDGCAPATHGCAAAPAPELRLLPGRTIAMSAAQRAELVDALAELLADHIQATRRQRAGALRSDWRPDLVRVPQAKEQQ